MTLITRRMALSGLATTLAAPALAQTGWPQRPVTLIVPQAAGGTNDLIGRFLADKLSDLLGQRFVVDNRVGAGGNIGQAAMSRAVADGQTVMVTTSSSHVTNPNLYPNPGFDPLKDYAPISMLARLPLVLCVNPSFPARTTGRSSSVRAAPRRRSRAARSPSDREMPEDTSCSKRVVVGCIAKR